MVLLESQIVVCDPRKRSLNLNTILWGTEESKTIWKDDDSHGQRTSFCCVVMEKYDICRTLGDYGLTDGNGVAYRPHPQNQEPCVIQ